MSAPYALPMSRKFEPTKLKSATFKVVKCDWKDSY